MKKKIFATVLFSLCIVCLFVLSTNAADEESNVLSTGTLDGGWLVPSNPNGGVQVEEDNEDWYDYEG